MWASLLELGSRRALDQLLHIYTYGPWHETDSKIWFSSFHTYDYVRHFVSTCTRILGVEASPAGIEYQGRLTRVALVCAR